MKKSDALGICTGVTLKIQNFIILIMHFYFFALKKISKVPSDLFYGGICLTKLKVKSFLVGMGMRGTQVKFQNSE
jgi:hypothetical protein